MATVDPVFAQWLQERALWHLETDATLSARWGTRAQTTERLSPLALKADADAEATRQIAFLGGPLVEDEHLVLGAWSDKLGQVVTITGDRLGYAAGVDCFVIGVQDDRAAGTSRLSVLRRLA